MVKRITRRAYWRMLRFLGFSQLAWDDQFEAGMWSDSTRSPHTIRRVAELCAGGRLIEFGCGEGHLPFLLPADCFSQYTGYDISGVAIRRASQRAIAAGRGDIRFERCDMAEWLGSDAASLILAEECLYYLPAADIRRFLQRCVRSLAANGAILVIVHSASKHAKTLDLCRRVCRVANEAIIGSRAFLTLTSHTADERMPVDDGKASSRAPHLEHVEEMVASAEELTNKERHRILMWRSMCVHIGGDTFWPTGSGSSSGIRIRSWRHTSGRI